MLHQTFKKKGANAIMLLERNCLTRPQKELLGLQRVTWHLEETSALDLE